MKHARLADGERLAAMGQGTWMMGENAALRRAEADALRRGIDLGMTLLDTAEMYGEGAAETLVGEVIASCRDEVFVVSKAYPQNASRTRLPQACDRSLQRLRTDRIDLYLLHWRGSVPLAETVQAMEDLKAAGKIRHWGVSNFDTDDMAELVDAGGIACVTDQVLYNLGRRGAEYDLLPWLHRHAMPLMAYSPVERGGLVEHAALASVAAAHGVSRAQVALAWLLLRDNVIVIPKAGSVAHVEDNHAALSLSLTPDDIAALDRAFPAPTRKRALEML
jgi:diketogulonate reductase-like aldo/keto reductase